MELTLGAALLAGFVSFLSPCVLPVVPAYLGQLGALTVVGAPTVVTTSPAPSPAASLVAAPGSFVLGRRWYALLHALVFVGGFTAVFTLLGVTATYAAGPIGEYLPFLRQVGGVVLIVLGLNVMGILRLPLLMRSWRPFDTFGRRGGGPVGSTTPLGAFGLGAIFALGWTPCIGPTLGAIFGLSALGPSPQVGALFVAYSIGLGLPFLGLALALDRAPSLIRPLQRHGRTVELVGGALIVLIGVAILFDFLAFFYRQFYFLAPRV